MPLPGLAVLSDEQKPIAPTPAHLGKGEMDTCYHDYGTDTTAVRLRIVPPPYIAHILEPLKLRKPSFV